MMTRELDERDEANAVALLQRAAIGCRVTDALEARALWLRWLIETTVIGTFDDAGQLVALRAFDEDVPEALRHADGKTLRKRALVMAPEGIIADSTWNPRMAQGLLAYYASVGASRIVVPLSGTDFERNQAASLGFEIREGLGGSSCAIYDVDQVRKRLAGGAE
jgi:hypothetical protein